MNELKFPDGTIVDGWFFENKILELDNLPKYYLTDYIKPSDIVQTDKIQELIDIIAANNGGVLVVCGGNYKTGALFFKQGVHLYIEKDSMIIGSDDICDYPVMMTRIEGESCLYYPALINAYDVDGFVIYGGGIIDGNGLKSWKAFWQRRKWNPACKNKDEQRPRLVYISNSKNVFISGITMQNSHFWTSHIYKCDKVKFLGCKIYSPANPVKAPSTDAIDIDACTNVLVHGCDISVNDDAIVLKGGKGPYADTDSTNGSNEYVLISDCNFGFCHSCLTCGSESIHNRNVIMHNCLVDGANNLLWLKMRPDTPQMYEYILVENVKGKVVNGIYIKPWTQFFDLKDRCDIPLSYADNIYMKNLDLVCDRFYNISKKDNQYVLSNFVFENINVQQRVNSSVDEEILKKN